jgi:long-chain acyl-CoA synthetase
LPDLTLDQAARAALTRDPSLPAIEYAGRWRSWGEVASIAGAVTNGLATLGCTQPGIIAFAPRNRPSSLAALLALVAGGHDIIMHYAFQPAAAIAEAVVRSDSGIAVIEGEDTALLAALQSVGVSVIALNDTDVSIYRGRSVTPMPTGAGHVAILTSGTTGPAKHMRLSPDLIITHHVNPVSLSLERAAHYASAAPVLLYFPLANISGIYSTIPPLLRGQRVCLLDRFTLADWRAYVRIFRPAHSGIPPAAMAELLDADIPPAELSSLQTMGLGAAPLDPAMHRQFEERYAIAILLSYGATEFAGPVCAMTAELQATWGSAKRGSVGRALPGAALREVISPRLGPAWIRTADMAVLDADDFLWLRGRADGAINRGGFKLLPESIERALNQHPAVAESAVVGIADARLGQIPAAAIRTKMAVMPPSQHELASHIRDILPPTYVPVVWKFIEEIPRNASMKIDRVAVAALFAAPDISTAAANK